MNNQTKEEQSRPTKAHLMFEVNLLNVWYIRVKVL